MRVGLGALYRIKAKVAGLKCLFIGRGVFNRASIAFCTAFYRMVCFVKPKSVSNEKKILTSKHLKTGFAATLTPFAWEEAGKPSCSMRWGAFQYDEAYLVFQMRSFRINGILCLNY